MLCCTSVSHPCVTDGCCRRALQLRRELLVRGGLRVRPQLQLQDPALQVRRELHLRRELPVRLILLLQVNMQ